MSLTIIPHDQIIDIPEDVAVCPYCRAKLTVRLEEWTQNDDGTWGAGESGAHGDCTAEPDVESSEWDAWLEIHSDMPYVHQLPVDLKVTAWINANFRFDMEKSAA